MLPGKLPNTPVPPSLERVSPRSSTKHVCYAISESECTGIGTRNPAYAHARDSKTATCEVCMPLHVSWSHSPRQIFGSLRFVCPVLIIGMLVPRNTRVSVWP
jgi:hypothetical protein